jgi:hypothetical protein
LRKFGITFYDALVGANVPPDKARALVPAMERERFERLATRQDLQAHQSMSPSSYWPLSPESSMS